MLIYIDHGRTKPIPRGKKKDKSALLEMEGSESKCLVRATNGKKTISTVVGNIFREHVLFTSFLGE